MKDKYAASYAGLGDSDKPAIRFLVESALRSVMQHSADGSPSGRDEWLMHLCDALVSDSDSTYQTVVAQLISSGVSTEEILHDYIPDAARMLGELWVDDKASFVDVTVGASRLQALFRSQSNPAGHRLIDRAIPLGKSVLMVVPDYEQHSLGAFVAADEMRRKGLWVHMGISLTAQELAELLTSTRFAMVGLSLGSESAVEKAADVVTYLRGKLGTLPPIVVGGVAAEDRKSVENRSGADYAVQSVQEAIEVSGLMAPRHAMSGEQAG